MGKRVSCFIRVYLALLLLFVVQKPVFLLLYRHLVPEGVRAADHWQVLAHGLPLDLAMAAYLSIVPALLLLISLWTGKAWLRKAFKIYLGLAACLIALTFVLNLALYKYWGFPLDSTPFFYFFTNPGDTLTSAGLPFAIGGIALFALCAWLAYKVLCMAALPRTSWPPVTRKAWATLAMAVLAALLFIPIRGGFSVATLNTGRVYYSQRMPLNHAATNPMFSLMESLAKAQDLAAQYRFLPAEEADAIFKEMTQTEGRAAGDTLTALFSVPQPDITLIILESFSAQIMASLGGQPGVAVRLDSLAGQGVAFTRFYADSFRTDRGLVSILSGYPASPTISLMKYPSITRNLPSLARALAAQGYVPAYYYGGDDNFTHMHSYLVESGFAHIVAEKDLPRQGRRGKWGVNDDELLRYTLQELKQPSPAPRFNVVQTSSSHEPFEVPYHRLADPALNAFAYADSCVGAFIDSLKVLPNWNRHAVVLVADHLGAYPPDIDNLSATRYHIPLIVVGGAVRGPRTIDAIGSQHDLAATLLAAIGAPHAQFVYGKDLLDTEAPHFAFFTFPDAFGMVTPTDTVVYDNKLGQTITATGLHTAHTLLQGKTYLQKLYDDITNR